MTQEQADALRRLASLRRKSQAAVLRDALDSLIADDTRSRRITRARAAAGAFRSGVSSTSEFHDDALIDAFS